MGKSNYEHVYCAFCKNKKKIYRIKHVSVKHFAVGIILSSLLSYLFWGGIQLNASIFFVTYIIGCEFFLRIRWRYKVICKNCGFDPVLYMRNREQSVERMKENLQARQHRIFGLKPLNLPVRVVKADKFKSMTSPSVKNQLTKTADGKLVLVENINDLKKAEQKGHFVEKSI